MKILIVEDDPMVCEINKKFAKRIPFVTKIRTSNTLDKAKEILRNEDFDLILLDIYFPKGKGTELLKWIRKNELGMDVILITADKSVETVEKAFRFGTIDYLIKPFKFDRFKKAICKVKDRREKFIKEDIINQETIDNYIVSPTIKYDDSNTNYNIQKGMSTQTYQMVLKAVKREKEPFTTEYLSEKIGLARVTTRRYLEEMLKKEIISVELNYGKVGRPQRLYKIKE